MDTHDELTDTAILRIQRSDRQAREAFVAHFIRTTAAVSLAAVSGCSTLERHPIAAAVVTGVVVGSLAASTTHRSPAPGVDVTTQPVHCTSSSCK